MGTRVPAYAGNSQDPASSRRTSASVKLPTGSSARPGKTCATSVVRANVVSWTTTRWPSLVRCTSNSTRSAPARAAAVIAGSVFSGATALSPRWAMTSTCEASTRGPMTADAAAGAASGSPSATDDGSTTSPVSRPATTARQRRFGGVARALTMRRR